MISVTSAEPSGFSSDQNLALKLIDVSATGACIVTPTGLREGMPLQVDLTVPGPGGGKYSARGSVRWTQFLEDRGGDAHLAGVEFETLIEALAGKVGESAILDILLTMRVAVAQLRLYPKVSPQVLKVVSDAYHSILSYLEGAGTLTLSQTPKGLLVNGRPLPAAGTVGESLEKATRHLLTDAQVKSITFKKGLTLDELIAFLHALTHKFWDAKDGKEINRRLREERVLQVSVDEVTYVALGVGDIVIEDAARKLQGGETEVERLLVRFDNLIEAAASEGPAAEVRLLIMKRLLDQDPSLLRRIGEIRGGRGAGGGGEGKGAEEEGRVSFETAREAVGEIARLLGEVPPAAQDALQRAGRVLADAFLHSPELSALMNAILSGKAAEAMPELARAAAVQSAEPAAVNRVTTVLGLPDDEKIQALAQEGTALMEELAALERPDLVKALVESLSAPLGDRSGRRRLSAVRALNALRLALEKHAPDDLLEALEIVVRSTIDQERDANVYHSLAELAGFLADLRIRRGGLDRAGAILDLLSKHYKIRDPGFVQRGEMAYMALERLASGTGLAGLSSKIRASEAEATRILEAVGAAAARYLIGEIKSATDSATRLYLAGFLARAGSGAATVLLDEVARTSVPSEVLRLIEVLPHSMPADMAELALGGLLRHPTVAVRRRTAAMVAEQAYPRAGAAVLDALKVEADPSTRLVFTESLGRLKYKGGLEALTELADSRAQPEDVRVAACLAIGRIGDVRSVAALARLCSRGEKGITKIFRLVSPAVRAAAIRALALFPGNKEAREALRKALEDGDPFVRSTAGQARYGPLYEAFGEAAHGIQMISRARELMAPMAKFAGSLSEVSLADVCRRIATVELGGLLSLNFNGPTARVYFDSGLVIAVEYEGRRDQDAFRVMAGRKEGYFLFQSGVNAPERRILVPVESLLQDSQRVRAVPRPASDSSAPSPPGA